MIKNLIIISVMLIIFTAFSAVCIKLMSDHECALQPHDQYNTSYVLGLCE